MKLKKIFYAVLLSCSLTIPAMAQMQGSEGEAGGGVICYAGSDGYLIGTPANWVNHQEIASQAGLCALYIPEGETINTSDLILYPQTNGIPANTSGSKAIKAVATQMLEEFRSTPSGEKLTAKKSGTIKTEGGLELEIWLFDEGPAPNHYEAIAYYAGKDSVFSLVLVAKTKAQRDNALPALEELAKKMLTLEVSVK